MAHLRHSGRATGARKVPHALWERAGARAGDGAGALFARLDAQDAQDAQDALNAQETPSDTPSAQAAPEREQAALALERLAAQIRAGVWSAQIAQIAALALSPGAPAGRSGEQRDSAT